MKYFKHDRFLITRGVHDAYSNDFIAYIFSKILEAANEQDLDYLQVFEFKNMKDSTLIIHSQSDEGGQKAFSKEYVYDEVYEDKKCYVIDDLAYATFMFAEEY